MNESENPNPNYKGSNRRMPWRLQIAVSAMKSLLSNPGYLHERSLFLPDHIAGQCFAIADAVLREYGKNKPRRDGGHGDERPPKGGTPNPEESRRVDSVDA